MYYASIFRNSTILLASALLAMFVTQDALAHCKGRHQFPHEHCQPPPPSEDLKTFDISITKTAALGFLDNDGYLPSSLYSHGDEFVTAEQGRHFVELNTGQNSPRKKVRKIGVDLGDSVVGLTNGDSFQSTDTGELDALVVVGGGEPVSDFYEMTVDVDGGMPTNLFLRGHNFEGKAVLVVSFNDPATADFCDDNNTSNANGDQVWITRIALNVWTITPFAGKSACVFLFSGEKGVESAGPQLVQMDGFTIVITEEP